MKKIVVFTGSGISAESGIKTFRDSGGLWEEYDIMEVATPQAWKRNPELVQNFYNMRRKQVMESRPNAAHLAIARLEEGYEVTVVTQNIDDLHERAGSSRIVHLHGEITKSRSEKYPELVYDIEGWELKMDAKCEKGYPLRPFIVWFGEAVPKMEEAAQIVSGAEIFITIGTSLEVYPAAGLIEFAPYQSEKYLVDPDAREMSHIPNMKVIREKAGIAVPLLVDKLLQTK